jgi:hypothetical protein
MHLSPDSIIFWQYGFFKLNATIVFTWGLMLVMAVTSKLVTRKLSTSIGVPLAGSSGSNRHGDREADCRGGTIRRINTWAFWGLFLFVATAACLPSFGLRAADRLRSRPQRRWPVCLRGRCSESKNRGRRIP